MAGFAEVDGVVTDADSFSINDWADLQTRVRRGQSKVVMPFCHCAGHQSVSVRSTPFFKHYGASTCVFANGKGESEEHIFAKHEIAAGVELAGWRATIEAASPPEELRWRADVLATGPRGERVVLEVQRSHLSTSGYRERILRYRRQGIESIWFVDGDEQGRSRVELSTPAFDVQIGFDLAAIPALGELGTTCVPLREFTRRWLLDWRPAWPGERTVENLVRHPRPLIVVAPQPTRQHIETKWAPRNEDLPSRDCVGEACVGYQLWSSILEAWVCMKCRRSDPGGAPRDQHDKGPRRD